MEDRASAMSRASSSASISCARAALDASSVYAMTRGALNRTSKGKTASTPYTIKNGMQFIDLFGVVRRLHSIEGRSSTQCPAALSSRVCGLILIPFITRPLAHST